VWNLDCNYALTLETNLDFWSVHIVDKNWQTVVKQTLDKTAFWTADNVFAMFLIVVIKLREFVFVYFFLYVLSINDIIYWKATN
jgi:hypothetical protein